MNKEFCESCNNIRNDIDSYDCGHNWIPFSEVNLFCDHIWVSVNEQLPPYHLWVLAYNKDWRPNKALAIRVDTNKWTKIWDTWDVNAIPTHWMRLPNSPKE